MIRYFAAYAATALVMVALDGLWLGLIAKPLYEQGIGHLMADRPNVLFAALFYVMFAMGLVVFAVLPQESAQGWLKAAALGAMFGLFAYATYDLTNLATLRRWPLGMSLMDMAWGSVVSAIAAATGKVAMDWFAVG